MTNENTQFTIVHCYCYRWPYLVVEKKNDRYVDLETLEHIDVIKYSTNGYMINAETKYPVGIYVDTESKDTIYGKTGKVINGI